MEPKDGEFGGDEAARGDRCAYCGTFHPPGIRERGYYRCHGCNLFIHEAWLVDEPEDWMLDSVHRLLCPWCGFPAGSEQDLRTDRETPCGGCGGSLSTDMLATQAELRIDRAAGRRNRHLILVVSSLILLGLVVLALVT